MKERYNSEKDLKTTFDNYQMPFDTEAFDQFTMALDKEEKKKKVIWWMFYGKFIIPFLILGLMVWAYHYYPTTDESNILSSANNENTNSNESTQVTSAVTSEPILHENDSTFSNSKFSPNNLSLFDKKSSKEQHSVGMSTKVGGYSKSMLDVKSETLKKEAKFHSEVMISESAFREKNQNSFMDSILLVVDKPLLNSSAIDIDSSFNQKETVEPSRVKGLLKLDLLDIAPLKSSSKENNYTYNGDIKPFKEKFSRYLYFNVGTGVSIEDNFGVGDQFFETLKPNEFIWYASAAYQISPRFSFEFGLMQKNLSLGFHLKDFTYWEKLGSKVNILRARIVNTIWSPSSNLNIHMTNGLSMVKSTEAFNDALDFSKGVSGMDDPDYISNINIGWKGLYSKNHFIYSGGLSVDFGLSKNVDLNIGAEYNVGLKIIMAADLNYVEGEGVNKKVETHTNGSFASLTMGLKYRLRRN